LFYKPTENPRVGGSIPPLATNLFNDLRRFQACLKKPLREFCVSQLTQNHQLGPATTPLAHAVGGFD
jgi:hypothetical protein